MKEICDDCCHLRSVLANWQSECRMLEAKVEVRDGRLERIRDALRRLEMGNPGNVELEQLLHRLVFN